jgi:hypothetical protein
MIELSKARSPGVIVSGVNVKINIYGNNFLPILT